MKYQNTFKRYELKYLLTSAQKEAVLTAISAHMKLDRYGRTTIRNIYFDTDNFRLIRRSLEKPVYKEKLRLRSYSLAAPDTEIFIELKKKYKSVVYKRRLSLPEGQAMSAFLNETPLPIHSQIGDEIEYFRKFYGVLEPKVFLSYEREAFYALDGSDLRITFDDDILYRTTELSLCSEVGGKRVLREGSVLMEIKTSGAIPLWLTNILSANNIHKTSFSKYGTAFADIIKQKGAMIYGR